MASTWAVPVILNDSVISSGRSSRSPSSRACTSDDSGSGTDSARDAASLSRITRSARMKAEPRPSSMSDASGNDITDSIPNAGEVPGVVEVVQLRRGFEQTAELDPVAVPEVRPVARVQQLRRRAGRHEDVVGNLGPIAASG